MHFIDYGNEGVASDIRVLPDDLQDLDACALRCALGWKEDDDFVQQMRDYSELLHFRVVDELEDRKILRVWTDEAHENEISTKSVAVE